MKIETNSLETLLFQGRYQELLAARPQKLSRELVPLVLGGLSFTGRLDEALALFALHEKSFNREQKISATFFLALGLIRTSDYAHARKLIAQNLLALRERPTARSRFYIHQGLAFYRYFCGRWDAGLRVATKAFEAALEDGFSYGKILSSDLRGHLLVQVHNVDEGLRFLGDAAAMARKHGNAAVADAAEISILTYEAQYGLRPKTIVQKLKAKLKSRDATDTYSRASLLLEISRQLMLRGQLPEVRAYLDEASRLIYMFKNRRQEALLNLRWAYLSLISGETYRALSFTQAAERCLDPHVDRSLELAALGLQLKIVQQLGIKEREILLENEIQTKSKLFGGMIHRRMLNRRSPLMLSGKGDRLGEMLDEKDVERVLSTGLLLLLYELKNCPWEQQIFWPDLTPGVSVVFDRGRVHTVTGLTPLMRKTLTALLQGHGRKDELIRQVWGYQYDPQRHDSLIYNTVTGLRKILGPSAHWIETTEAGYRMAAGIQLRADEVRPEKFSGATTALAPGLNHRQLTFLKKVKPGEFVHVRSYQKLFHVAEITACRDLASLHREGYVLRVGRARATRYTVTGDQR